MDGARQYALYADVDYSADGSVFSRVRSLACLPPVSLDLCLSSLGACVSALGACVASGPDTPPAEASLSFTLDSGVSQCFFRDHTTLTPLLAPVPVALADPSSGPAIARSSTTLPFPVVLSGVLRGLHIPSFTRNLVGVGYLQDTGITVTFVGGGMTAVCTNAATGAILATFTKESRSSLYVLHTERSPVASSTQVAVSPEVPVSGPVAVSGQVEVSGQVAASCSCRSLAHPTVLWHHRLGHLSLPRLCIIASHGLVSGLLRVFLSLPPSLAPPCTPYVAGRLCATPHSSLRLATAPFQTLHLDVTSTLIRWLLATKGTRGSRVRCLHSDRGGEFCSGVLAGFYGEQGIRQSWTLPESPLQNGVAERRIGLVMDIARTSMIHARAPHFLWPYALHYAAHQLNLQPRVSQPEVSPTSLWTGSPGVGSAFHVWGCLALVRGTSADKLSARTIPNVFLGFLVGSPDYSFYHPPLHPFLDSRDVTADSVGVGAGGAAADGTRSRGALSRGTGAGGAGTGGASSGGAGAGGTGSRGASSRGAGAGGAGTEETGVGGSPIASPTARPHRHDTRFQALHRLEREEQERVEQERLELQQLDQLQQQQQQTPQPQPLHQLFPPVSGLRALGLPSSPPVHSQSPTAYGPTFPPPDSTPAVFSPPQSQSPPPVVRHDWTSHCPPRAQPSSPLDDLRTVLFHSPPRRSPHVSVLPSPPELSLTVSSHPITDYYHAARPVVSRVLASLVTDPRAPLLSVSALTATDADFASVNRSCRRLQEVGPEVGADLVTPTSGSRLGWSADDCAGRCGAGRMEVVVDLGGRRAHTGAPGRRGYLGWRGSAEECDSRPGDVGEIDLGGASTCRLEYATRVVAAPPLRPLSVGGESALGCDVLQDRQLELEFLATASPSLCAILLSFEGDPDALDIPTPRMYHEPVSGEWASQWKVAMDSELGSWRSTGTYVKRPRGSPPVLKVRYVSRGFSQRPSTRGYLAAPSSWLHGHLPTWDPVEPEAVSLGSPLVVPDKAARTITLTQSHMVQQVLRQFGFQFSTKQPTPLAVDHRLIGPFPDEPFESSGPYAELVGCLIYLMTCTRPDLAIPLCVLSRFVATGRHRLVHWTADVRVAKYLATTSGMGLLLGGTQPVVLTGHYDSSYADDMETQCSTQG
ncbi:unnamed protein product [Closterium sp. NIES-53]